MGTARVYPLDVTRRQLADLAIHREGLGDTAEEMKADEAGWIRGARNLSACEQRLHLRGEAECPSVIRRVQRLDAVRIARQEKSPLLFVPNGEGNIPRGRWTIKSRLRRTNEAEPPCPTSCESYALLREIGEAPGVVRSRH
jgi:hypothetical protein